MVEKFGKNEGKACARDPRILRVIPRQTGQTSTQQQINTRAPALLGLGVCLKTLLANVIVDIGMRSVCGVCW